MSDKEQRVDNKETAGDSEQNLRMDSGSLKRPLSSATTLVASARGGHVFLATAMAMVSDQQGVKRQ